MPSSILTLSGFLLGGAGTLAALLAARRARLARDRSAADLVQASTLLAGVLEGLGEGSLLLSPDRKLLVLSQGARRIFGEPLSGELPSAWPARLRVFEPDQETLVEPDQGPLTPSAQGHSADSALLAA